MVKVGGVATLALLAGAGLAAQSPAPARVPANASAKAVVAAATKYVHNYAARMMFVVGDEIYAQETFDAVDHRTGTRLMKGELYLTFLEADRTWIAVHDIAQIDGEPVPNRTELPAILARGARTSVVYEVVQHNARFNIGRIERTFNEPTMPLLVLDKDRVKNFNFTRQDIQSLDGVTLVTLAFAERERPTIVMSTTGTPLFSRGELVIEAGTGRVRATHLLLKDGPVTADLMTTYALDSKLQMWLPFEFTERYEGELEGVKEIDTGRAQYSNFKRYEASGRIKKQ